MRNVVKLFFVCLLFMAGGCDSKKESTNGTLSGKITVNGKALTGGTIFGRVGEVELSGFINFQGEYLLENPPLGDIQLKIVAVPPPPPGIEVNLPVEKAGLILVPLENQNYSKDFVIRFEGGNQKYDIVLPIKK